jgi:hypothetical protein
MTTALRSEPDAVQLDEVQLCHPQVEGSAHRRLPSALNHPVATVVGTSAGGTTRPNHRSRHRLAPTVRRLADTTQAHGLDALVHLVGWLPQLADAMDHEVMPLLSHLEQVVPEINQLLDRAGQLSHMASRLPKVFR